MKYILKLEKRIKKNEGYRNKPYLDQLGNPTIGFGHLIKKNEKSYYTKRFKKKELNDLFIKDFNQALKNFNKMYKKIKINKRQKGVIIEMIFQLGIKKMKKFEKFNLCLKQKEFYLAAFEMMNSRWYIQTPKRVENLTKVFLGFKNE